MNALAYYLQMLARTPTTKAEEEKAVQDEARGLLLRLAEVDPDRKERYLDFGDFLFPLGVNIWLTRLQPIDNNRDIFAIGMAAYALYSTCPTSP